MVNIGLFFGIIFVAILGAVNLLLLFFSPARIHRWVGEFIKRDDARDHSNEPPSW